VKIPDYQKVNEMFFKKIKVSKPRHQRDVGKVLSLIKAFALLNVWFRKAEDGVVYANERDIEEAFKLWNAIYESQEYNLPPYIFDLLKEVIIPAYTEKGS